MREILGIPVESLMAFLLVILGVSLLTVAWIAWRRRVIFKMGMRNIPRRKAQTGLIVAGLNALPGVRCTMPKGAFYAFANVSGLFGKTWRKADGAVMTLPPLAVVYFEHAPV